MFQHSQMFRRGIAPMFGKSILWIFAIELLHNPITRYLGQDVRSSDTQAKSIASHEGRLFNWQSFDRQSVDKYMSRMMSIFF